MVPSQSWSEEQAPKFGNPGPSSDPEPKILGGQVSG